MVFRRRRQPTLAERMRGWLWPYIGWRRASRYLLMRIQRMPGTPHGIAAGLASGVAVSFTPFLGFHFLLAFALTWALGGNYLAAVIGTVVGNPWTFPLILAAAYELGCLIVGRAPSGLVDLANLSWEHLWGDAWRLLWPMTVGSLPLAGLAWIVTYFPLVRVIAVFQARRRRRLERRRLRLERRRQRAAERLRAQLQPTAAD
jgi:uncharacterized protein (DUF2062 family)